MQFNASLPNKSIHFYKKTNTKIIHLTNPKTWISSVTMKTGGFSCGKESLLQEVIHSEKLNGAFRRQRGGASVGRRGALRRQKRSFP